MRPKLIAAGTFVALILASPSSADPASAAMPGPAIGAGEDTCLEWATHHDEDDSQSVAEDQWLGGFLSGYNVFTSPDDRRATFFDDDLKEVPHAISGFCRLHPDIKISVAVAGFIRLMVDAKKRAERNN